MATKDKSLYWKIKSTDLERDALKAIAEREGLSMPEALRWCVRETAKRLGLWQVQNE
jgi:hypothetical protein